MATVDISTLAETAVRRQKDLKMLPYAVLRETLALHGINLLPGIQNKDTITDFLRKQGILKPYKVGALSNSELGKAQEMTLEVKTAYASVKDNIQNYKTTIIGPDELLGTNQSKKHPWQMVMLTAIVRTFGEDILDCLFPGEYDVDGTTPLDAFDGYDTLIDGFVTAGTITGGKGNYVSTGTIAAPTAENDYLAFEALLDFYRAANAQLRSKPSIMLVPWGIADMYDDAFFNKFRSKPTTDEYGRMDLYGTGGKCKLVRSNVMGTGQRIILTVPGNLDFGMDTLGDEEFVQVRTPYEDPNYVQFWIQGKYGTRIRSIHEKVFQVNEGSAVGLQLSGDYS